MVPFPGLGVCTEQKGRKRADHSLPLPLLPGCRCNVANSFERRSPRLPGMADWFTLELSQRGEVAFVWASHCSDRNTAKTKT